MKNVIKPGNFGKAVSADNKRLDFDFHNEQLIYNNTEIDYLFIGDSLTLLWELKAYFNKNKVIINRGIGGDSTEYVLKRFEADALQLNPKHIILLIGTNDISAIEGDVWWRREGEPSELVVERTFNNIKEIAKLCMERGQRISIASIPPTDAPPHFKKEERNRLVMVINKHIQKICTDYNLLYIDYHSKLCMDDGRTLIYDYSPDGIHVNAKAYRIMADVLKHKLNENGEDI